MRILLAVACAGRHFVRTASSEVAASVLVRSDLTTGHEWQEWAKMVRKTGAHSCSAISSSYQDWARGGLPKKVCDRAMASSVDEGSVWVMTRKKGPKDEDLLVEFYKGTPREFVNFRDGDEKIALGTSLVDEANDFEQTAVDSQHSWAHPSRGKSLAQPYTHSVLVHRGGSARCENVCSPAECRAKWPRPLELSKWPQAHQKWQACCKKCNAAWMHKGTCRASCDVPGQPSRATECKAEGA